ncbi:HupE/UreJ family protein [Halovulum sp. GXIMD14794]
MTRLAACCLIWLMVLAGAALPHALQPGFLDLKPVNTDIWRVYWKVPTVGAGRMQIDAVLPETCDARSAGQMRFDGTAYVAEWLATCPGGLTGGTITIEGLEATQTDVLVRYETKPGAAQSQRLTPATPAFTIPEPLGTWGIVATYTELGISHILRGVDHLMFVFALILLIRDRRRLIGAVTAFTVAHSISLAAAALGWIVVPAPPVEAIVALSIMFLAAELLRSGQGKVHLSERYPWVVAFAFGLLHGLGFARALLEVGLPEGEVPLALFAFNVGVEIGQLMFIALVLIVGALLGRLYQRMVNSLSTPGRRGLATMSYAMGGIAAVWFVTRIAAF